MLHQYRRAVARTYLTAPHTYHTGQLTPDDLNRLNISVLALDFDGVLAAHGETQPTPELIAWLKTMVAHLGNAHVFILSNKPTPERVAFFAAHFAGVRVIAGVRKKPYPDGLKTIMDITQQPASAILLVDDRLLTGVLAACIAQTQIAYITHPHCNFNRRPVQESFFWSLRFLERRLMQSYCWLRQRQLQTDFSPSQIKNSK
ncbi:YqeG family HAD IIIA-type phosphatase [Thioflexithrix psekupsensis]|nr:HAD family hydrolase [Thioflexithrix psekupsensis]